MVNPANIGILPFSQADDKTPGSDMEVVALFPYQ
jgi:hypothetical protein